MKRRLSTVACLVLATLLIAGCNTPSKRWASGAITFTTTEKAIAAFHDAGVIKDEELVALKPALVGGKSLLDKARTCLPEGGPVFETVWAGFEAYLTELAKAQAAAEKKSNG